MTIDRHPTSALSADFGDIVAHGFGSGWLEYTLKQGSTVILQEIYHPDADGVVRVRNIGDICADYSRSMAIGDSSTFPVVAFESTMGFNNGTTVTNTTVNFSCFPCLAATGDTLSPAVLVKMPLTRTTSKRCTKYSAEYFSFYGVNGRVDVKALVAFTAGGANLYREVLVGHFDATTANVIHHAVVDYTTIAALVLALGVGVTEIHYWDVFASYTGPVLSTQVRYELNRAEGIYPQFVYRNALMGQDCLVCRGVLTQELKANRKFGYINDQYTVSGKTPDRKYIVNTGFLTEAERAAKDDLLEAETIRYSDDGGATWCDVVITDEKFVSNNRKNTHSNYEITFRKTARNPLEYRYTAPAYTRVFDPTFDVSFD